MERRANSLVELTTSGEDNLSIFIKYQAMKQEAQVLITDTYYLFNK